MSWNLILCLWLLHIWFIFVLLLAQTYTRELGLGCRQCHSGVNGLNVGRNFLISVSIFCLGLGRGTVFLPEDTSSDCEDEDQTDSICRGLGISVGSDPRNIKFEVFSTRIHEGKRKQCVVSPSTNTNVHCWEVMLCFQDNKHESQL